MVDKLLSDKNSVTFVSSMTLQSEAPWLLCAPLCQLTDFLLQQKTTGMDIIAAVSSFLSCPAKETKTPWDGRYDAVSVWRDTDGIFLHEQM